MEPTQKLTKAILTFLERQTTKEPTTYQRKMVQFIAERFIEHQESSTMISLMIQGSPSYPSNRDYLTRALVIGAEFSRALLREQGNEDEEI